MYQQEKVNIKQGAEARYKAMEYKLKKKQSDNACERVVVKMPKTPEVKNVVDGIAGDAWTKFGIGTIAFASQRNEELGEMHDQILQDPERDARSLLDRMTEAQRKLDQVMFMSMNENASRNVMMFIGDMDECRHGNTHNGLLVCSVVGQMVDHSSVGKRMIILDKLTQQ